MAVAHVPVKKWGNSLGVILPADIAKEIGLAEKDFISIEIRKTATLADMFGSLKGWKMSGQQIKNEARKGW